MQKLPFSINLILASPYCFLELLTYLLRKTLFYRVTENREIECRISFLSRLPLNRFVCKVHPFFSKTSVRKLLIVTMVLIEPLSVSPLIWFHYSGMLYAHLWPFYYHVSLNLMEINEFLSQEKQSHRYNYILIWNLSFSFYVIFNKDCFIIWNICGSLNLNTSRINHDEVATSFQLFIILVFRCAM